MKETGLEPEVKETGIRPIVYRRNPEFCPKEWNKKGCTFRFPGQRRLLESQ